MFADGARQTRLAVGARTGKLVVIRLVRDIKSSKTALSSYGNSGAIS